MAETVKKSRIVSDDDLEESLMQEFNIRLKHCMSQEQMQEPSDDEEENVKEVIKLEFNSITTNGKEDDSIYDEVCPINSNERFLFEERNVYADTNGVSLKNRLNDAQDEILRPQEEEDSSKSFEENLEKKQNLQNTTDEVIYDEVKTVRPVLQLPTTCLTDMSDSIEQDVQDLKGSVKDRMLLSTDDTSCLLFTQTVTSPMLTPSEENIDFLKGFQRQSSQNTTSTSENTQSENIASSKVEDADQQNEDITESSNISDKLDVEYENMQQVNTEGDISEVDNLGPSTLDTNQVEMEQEKCDTAQNEHIYEAIEDDGDERQEQIYENMEMLRKQSQGSLTDKQIITKEFLERERVEEEKNRYEENIYENIEDTEEEEIELSNAESIEELQSDVPEKSIPDVCLEANEKLDSQIKCSQEEYVDEEIGERKLQSPIPSTYQEELLQVVEDVESNYAVEMLANEREIVEHQEDCRLEKENEELLSSQSVEIAESHQREIEESIPPENEIGSLEGECSDLDEKSLDNPSKMVDALKTKFMTNTTAEIVKTASIEKNELNQLKTVDIMKQINKFENKSPGKDDGDDEENNINSTEMTESRFVETTTTIETSSSSVQDKSLKKKKSKKSRSHDKENISVNEINTDDTNMQEENFYNVNVKNLCRSFGDLTKIEDDKQPKEKPIRDRTKSLGDARSFEILKMVDNVFSEVSVKALMEIFSVPRSKTNTSSVITVRASEHNKHLKSSFNKFDALQKKNVLHVRSSDSSTAQEKFNGAAPIDNTNCKACGKVVFQMEQIKAEKSVWHKNCFRCQECSKQLTVDTYQSNEGTVYCKPHFKSLFAPKAVEDEAPPKPRKHELIIRENQPLELPPDVVRASDKPDLGLEELQSLNVKERFQVFEHYEENHNSNVERGQVSVKRSPSILSKLAKFQSKGMDVGVTDDSLNGIPIEESASEEEPEEEEEIPEGEDADLIRAKKAQKEKPFHFTNMSDVKNKWEHGEQNSKEMRREERKQELQSIRDRLFMGKQGKMKEAYQQAVMESESCTNIRKAMSPPPEACDTRTLKEKFEKGETYEERREGNKEADDMSVFESGISKKSRSIFLELDANASKAPQISPVSPPKAGTEVKKAREAFMARQSSEDTVKSSQQIDDVKVETSDIQQRFKFFEAYKEPEQKRKVFRITPPREGQLKAESPDREIYRDPDVVRAAEQIEDSVIAEKSHTTTKVLNKFRQMEESMHREPLPLGPKPLKRFTPPPEPARQESSSEGEGSESEEESEGLEEVDHNKMQDADLVEAQKAARARQLRAKFEKWEAKEIKREQQQQQQQVNIIEEIGDEQAQIESTKALRARFESLKDSQNQVQSSTKVKVNRFVDTTSNLEVCYGCKERVYPLEKISIHEQTYHKKCFKCKECNTVLRMDSYTYNQGLLYCIPHFKRLFIAKGNYDTAFGLEQRKEKWNTTVA